MANSTLLPKAVAESAVEGYFYKVFPEDLNASDSLFGGKIMSILDVVASIVAEKHSTSTCVTAAVDSVHFLNPAKSGDVLLCQAALNRTWHTSMEIGVRVLANNYKKPVYSRHLVSAYFTFVALDAQRKPVAVPPVIPETIEQHCRYKEAEMRRLHRQQIVAEKSSKAKKIDVGNPSYEQ